MHVFFFLFFPLLSFLYWYHYFFLHYFFVPSISSSIHRRSISIIVVYCLSAFFFFSFFQICLQKRFRFAIVCRILSAFPLSSAAADNLFVCRCSSFAKTIITETGDSTLFAFLVVVKCRSKTFSPPAPRIWCNEIGLEPRNNKNTQAEQLRYLDS